MISRLALPLLLFASHAMAADHACLIEPRQVLKLAAPVQGIVASVPVDRGSRVKQGQLVARLDSAVEEANLAIARLRAANDTEIAAGQAKLDFLRRKMARKDRLQNNDYGSAAALDEAQSDAKVAEALLRGNVLNFDQAKLEAIRAEGLLHQRQIFSPVNGIVTERTLGQGEFVNDQAHILTIAEMDPLRVEAFLPIAVYNHIKIGDSAEVMPEAPVGGTYRATVVVVDQVFDAASNTVGVRLELPNPELRLPAGVHCRVRFDDPP